MINKLTIRNFKSVRQLDLDCSRINIFIGEPNSGKSNILEALGIYSYGCYFSYAGIHNFVRFERTSNFFYDEILDQNIEINADGYSFNLKYANGKFQGLYKDDGNTLELQGGHDNIQAANRRGRPIGESLPVKLYRFAIHSTFSKQESDFLLPPHGENLLSLLLGNRNLRSSANQVFSKFGLRLVLEPQEQKIKIQKQTEDIVISYPYSLASDTLQRMIFHISAVLSNKGSILVFEEPESHAFPYYTKHFAEMIALDEHQNQYFISTHNPYFLLPILEKTPKDTVSVFITHFDDYETRVKRLTSEQMDEIMQIDVFSNLDRYLESE